MRGQANDSFDLENLDRLLSSGAEKLGLELTNDAVEDLLTYFFELVRWSRKMNLIGRRMSTDKIVENHFLDSLTLLPVLDSKKPHLLDVGSGAGFPGLVCKAVKKDLELTIVEPRLKRVSFLRHIVRTIQLKGVVVRACRIEDESLVDSRAMFSHITSRAVTDLSAFLQMINRFVRPGVDIVCMKGPMWEREMSQASEDIEAMSLTLVRKSHYNLPFSKAKRTVLVFRRLQ